LCYNFYRNGGIILNWDLTAIFKDTAEWEKSFEIASNLIEEVANMKGTLND